MAHLKGGTYVDGSLYVKESLLVNTITTPEGRLPHIVGTVSSDEEVYPGFENHLVIFNNNEGAITVSPVEISAGSKNIQLSIKPDQLSITLLDDPDKSTITFTKDSIMIPSYKDIELDTNGRTWKFV